ncbi:hypothetical protein DDE05_27215 [Streptomyces cavourensis]|nr:hypothetical protein DDE05_27215 [Streptomyces cavourensis]
MDAKQIRQFIVLSETRSFSVAAQKLHLSQSALSTSIRKLEEEFDCQLFHRTSRGVDLTVAGQAAAVELRAAAVNLAWPGKEPASPWRAMEIRCDWDSSELQSEQCCLSFWPDSAVSTHSSDLSCMNPRTHS